MLGDASADISKALAIEVHVQREISELLCTRSALSYMVDDSDSHPAVVLVDGAPAMERIVAELSVSEFFINREDALIQATEYAQRLTACWNSCRGIPTEVLLSGRELIGFLNPPADELAKWKIIRNVFDPNDDITELEALRANPK